MSGTTWAVRTRGGMYVCSLTDPEDNVTSIASHAVTFDTRVKAQALRNDLTDRDWRVWDVVERCTL